MSGVLRALSVSEAPFWAWWLAPVGITAVVAVGAAVSHRERHRHQRRARHGEVFDDYADFRRAMARVRRGGGRR
jgi:hypothetical protein